MKLQKLFFAAVIVLSANAAFAQDNDDTTTDFHNVTITIPEFALLDLESSSGSLDFALAGTIPLEAGEAMTFADIDAKNTSIWINYSSIVGSTTEPARNVSVQITSILDVPAGLELTVIADKDAGKGDGTMGNASILRTLSKFPQDIITGIGSAYTGDGDGSGHQLTYQLGYATIANYAGLDFDNSAALEITYTLSDI